MARRAILIVVIFLLIFLSIGTNALGAEMAWQGTITLDFVDLPPLQFEGMGIATHDGPGIGLEFMRFDGGITASAATPVLSPTDPSFTLSIGASVALGAGTLGPFWPPQPLSANRLPLGGFAKICVIFPGCGVYIRIPLTVNFGGAGVGVGGLLGGGAGAVRISIDTAPWTVGTLSLSLPTPSGDMIYYSTRGWVHGAVSFAGSTALTGGELSVVTPIHIISTTHNLDLTAIARLEIRFVPEPLRWVLILAGTLGLALLGKARRSRRTRGEEDPEEQQNHHL